MKFTNWRKKFASTLVAAGVFVPGVAIGTTIPIGDSGFEDYSLVAAGGGAYAYSDQSSFNGSEGYRTSGSGMVSAWEDDRGLSNNDIKPSNFIYNAAYAEGGSHGQAAPVGGGQAMQGRGHYNSQDLTDIYVEGATYTFSIFAQGQDDGTPVDSRFFMHFYDASISGNIEAAANVASIQYREDNGDFSDRDPGGSIVDSQNNWTQLSLTHTVLSGAPEIGQPIGIGLWVDSNAAVDNASLEVTGIPEPSTILLVGLGGVSLLTARRRR